MTPGDFGPGGLDPNNPFGLGGFSTEEEIEGDKERIRLQKQELKEAEKLREEALRFRQSLAQMGASAFASSRSIEELGQNSFNAAGQIASALVSKGGGIGAILAGGVTQFGFNLLGDSIFGGEEKLDTEDDVIDVRIIDVVTPVGLAYVRDRSEQSYRQDRNSGFDDLLREG